MAVSLGRRRTQKLGCVSIAATPGATTFAALREDRPMVSVDYMIAKPPPPSALRRLFNQRAMPAAIDAATRVEDAVHTLGESTRPAAHSRAFACGRGRRIARCGLAPSKPRRRRFRDPEREGQITAPRADASSSQTSSAQRVPLPCKGGARGGFLRAPNDPPSQDPNPPPAPPLQGGEIPAPQANASSPQTPSAQRVPLPGREERYLRLGPMRVLLKRYQLSPSPLPARRSGRGAGSARNPSARLATSRQSSGSSRAGSMAA